MLNKNSLLKNKVDSFPYNGYIISGGSIESGYGYKEGEFGSLYGNIDFISRFQTISLSEDQLSPPWYFVSSLFEGKSETDGNVAHVYECEFKSDIYSGKVFLAPDFTKTNLDSGVTRYTYPGSAYVFMTDIPDRINFYDKDNVFVDSFAISYPMKKTEKVIGAHWTANFMKGDVLVRRSVLGLGGDLIEVPSGFLIGDRCDISMRITSLTGGGI